MKKVIWLFGEPGSGRQTLVDNIKEDKNNVRELLHINTNDISSINIPYDRDKMLNDYNESFVRANTITKKVIDFIDGQDEVLLIVGDYIDIGRFNDNSLKRIDSTFPDIEKEIYFVNPKDHDILYDRFKDSEWFKINYNKNLERFPREWLDVSVKYLRERLFAYEEYGYKVTEIDTTEGYKIENPIIIKNK